MKKFLLFGVLSLVLGSTACNNNKVITLQEEISILKDSIRQLNDDIDAYRLSPQKLCANINEMYAADDLNGLTEINRILKKYHPEAKEVTIVYDLRNKIIAKQQKREEEEKKKRLQAISKLKKEYDDVSGTTWYKNPYFSHHTNSNKVSIYIGRNDSQTWLRLILSYYGSDWIFFERAYLSYDGNTKEIYFNEYTEKKTDNYTSIWEWIDVSVDYATLSFLKDMITGKEVKVRFSGKYTKTRILSKEEINGIRDVLLGYDVLLREAY